MLEQLLAQSGEVPLIEMQMGGGGNTAPALLVVAPSGSWTIFALSPNGGICIVVQGIDAQPATGDGFPAPLPRKDS